MGIAVSLVRLLAAAGLVAGGGASADEHPALDRFAMTLGGIHNRIELDGRFDDRERGLGTRIDFDRTLGLDPDDTTAVAAIAWRPLHRHQFGLEVFRGTRDGRRAISGDIVFEGTTYLAGAAVETQFEATLYDFTYTWWGWIGERGAVGVQLGAVGVDADVTLEGTAEIVDVGSGRVRTRATGEFAGPKLGLAWRRALGDDWRLVIDLAAFELDVGDFDGRVLDGSAGIHWYPWEHLGIVAEYGFTGFDAEGSKGDFDGLLDLRFRGPRLALRLRF